MTGWWHLHAWLVRSRATRRRYDEDDDDVLRISEWTVPRAGSLNETGADVIMS